MRSARRSAGGLRAADHRGRGGACKKLPGCRASAFDALDKPALRPLPATRMPIARFKRARVNIDYHVELDGHYCSVPHRLVRAQG